MAIEKWYPLWEIQDLFDRYTRAGGVPRGGQALARTGDWTPRVDIAERSTAWMYGAVRAAQSLPAQSP